MRLRNYINGIEGLVAGGVATVNIPVGRRYHSLKIFANNTTTAGVVNTIASIRLYVNGILMRDLTAAQARNIALMNRTTADLDVTEIPLYFSEPWRASPLGEETTSWDLFGQQKCTLEIVFLAGPLANLTCQVLAEFDFGRNEDKNGYFLAIVKQLRQTYQLPTGQSDIVNIPTTYPISRLLLDCATATISACEVYNNQVKVQEGLVLQNTRFLKDHLLDGTKFKFPIVFDWEQQVSSALLVAKQGDLLVRPTLSAADAVTVIIESRAPAFA